MLAGAFQNRMTAWATSEETRGITEEYLVENTNYVGAGEWLPTIISDSVTELSAPKDVVVDGGSLIYPLIYYKGYEAWAYTEQGKKIECSVAQNKNGLVTIEGMENINDEIHVEYTGTMIQKISTTVSGITLVCILACWYKKQSGKKV